MYKKELVRRFSVPIRAAGDPLHIDNGVGGRCYALYAGYREQALFARSKMPRHIPHPKGKHMAFVKAQIFGADIIQLSIDHEGADDQDHRCGELYYDQHLSEPGVTAADR